MTIKNSIDLRPSSNALRFLLGRLGKPVLAALVGLVVSLAGSPHAHAKLYVEVFGGFTGKVEAALKKIDPSVKVNKKTGEVTQDPKVGAKGKRKGHALIRRLIASGHTTKIWVNVRNLVGNASRAVDSTRRSDAKTSKKNVGKDGSSTNIQWGGRSFGHAWHADPWEGRRNKKGKAIGLAKPITNKSKRTLRKRAGYLTLAHELIHADHNARGNVHNKRKKNDARYTDATGKKATGSPREQRVLGWGPYNDKDDITEQDIALENGEPVRLSVGK